MPKIKHLAIVCMDPKNLAKFYCEVFEMKEVTRSTSNGHTNVFLTDGYMNVALLSQKAEGKTNGLNPFRLPCRGRRRHRGPPEELGHRRPDRSPTRSVGCSQL